MKNVLLTAVAALAFCGPALALDCSKELDDQVALSKQHLVNVEKAAQIDQMMRTRDLTKAPDATLNAIVNYFNDVINEDNFLVSNANKLHTQCGGPVVAPTGEGIAAMAEARDLAQAELRRRR